MRANDMVAIEWLPLVPGLIKALLSAAAGEPVDAAKDLIDTAAAAPRRTPQRPTAERGARLLLVRGMGGAATAFIRAHARDVPRLAAEADPREIAAAVEGLAAGAPVVLTRKTFHDPALWPVMPAVVALFERWLIACDASPVQVPRLRRIFADAMPTALAAALRVAEHADDYAALREAMADTPLDPAAQRIEDWRAYRDRLIWAVRTPLRALAPETLPKPFSLTDLYVPLRAALGDDDPAGRGRRVEEGRTRPVVWLDDALHAWASRPAPERGDTIRIISGEPGAGKSSACAMLAARLAAAERRVVLVPLTRLGIGGDPRAALARYLEGELGHDALGRAREEPGEPLVLILDGLDELAKAGADWLLSGFIGALCNEIALINDRGVRVLLLLAGRPGAVQSLAAVGRGREHRLHVLRYRTDEGDRHRFTPPDLASLDQREEWWRRFDPAGGMPKALKRHDRRLAALTDQPLLNWLLAQVLCLDAGLDAGTVPGVHGLYARLFGYVLDRVHRLDPGTGANEPIDRVERAAVERMLMEVAVAAWHGGGDRAVPLATVAKRLKDAGLDHHLAALAADRDPALTVLLDSFFCRTERGVTDPMVEFTHTSFGQFLVARRLVQQIEDSHATLQSRFSRRGQEGVLFDWLDLCGAGVLDEALLDFLNAEVAFRAAETGGCVTVGGWRRTLVGLFEDCATHGMPLPGGVSRAREAERLTGNAESALFFAAAAAVDATRADVTLPWVRLDGDVLVKTLQRHAGAYAPLRWPLSGSLPISLREADLSRASLANVSLREADLTRADFTDADLMGADLGGADLPGAVLRAASLQGAVLAGADMTGTDLTSAYLGQANLRDAVLTGAILIGGILDSALLEDADLTDADLAVTDLENADLTGAVLRGANLRGARLKGANLTSADLTGAGLTDATLEGAILLGATVPAPVPERD